MDDGLKRIIRLVGDGKDEMSGGGLPLPDAFAAVLQRLLNHGPAFTEVLVKEVMSALSFKEDRILAIWGSWESFTDDIIVQLGVKMLVTALSRDGDRKFRWSITGDFGQGNPYEVISEKEITLATGKPGLPITVTAWDAPTMENKNEIAKLILALNGWERKTRRAGKMDPFIEQRLTEITARLEDRESGDPTNGLPDEPGTLVVCPGCEKTKALTRDNFVVYPSRGKHYWRVKCKSCGKTAKSKDYQDELRSAIERLTVGKVLPTATDVYLLMKEEGRETSVKAVGLSWDRQARAGDLPYRP